MQKINNIFNRLTSLDNLFRAWREFKRGKNNKIDVKKFEWNLEQNIFQLQRELENQTYKHGSYDRFHIYDPKHRIIDKAKVQDRLVHHIIFKEFCNIFDSTFIYHSYSSRKKKGTHLAIKNLSRVLRKVSKNYTKPVYVLKCDIKKFFHSVSHQKLFGIIKNKVKDDQFLWLIKEIISSFPMPVDNFAERERES